MLVPTTHKISSFVVVSSYATTEVYKVDVTPFCECSRKYVYWILSYTYITYLFQEYVLEIKLHSFIKVYACALNHIWYACMALFYSIKIG